MAKVNLQPTLRGIERTLLIGIALMLFICGPAQAQDNFRDVIEMSVEVGFNAFFRPGDWTPVVVGLENNGESILGRVVVRPETSGTVVGNAFSTPVDLPSGAAKSVLLNIRARSFPDRIRVELIDRAGAVRAVQDASLFDLGPQDQLYAIVIGPNSVPPNLTSVHVGGFTAEQAVWAPHDIPEYGESLESLDMMMLVNIDSESLSAGQASAIRHWVQAGGHLVVTGGPAAVISASGKTMLPRILIEHLEAGRVPPEHIPQCQGGMWIAEREWLDFRGYWPGMPNLSFRIERDDAWIEGTLAPAVRAFIDELEVLVARLTAGESSAMGRAA